MAKSYLPTFEVDKEGLRKLLAKRGKAFVITELAQNSWDEDAARVDVTLTWVEEPKGKGEGLALVRVEDDDPEGFTDFTHAYTLFAESEKKGDVEKRGRFNIGEKLVVAVCESAAISTTTGTAEFNEHGRRMLPAVREHGSVFTGRIRMTADEYAEVERAVEMLLPPAGVVTTFNGVELARREPLRSFEDKVLTVVGPELTKTVRKTAIRLYAPTADETPHFYEMGIPVVETGGIPWHVEIMQKVPLNTDRTGIIGPAWGRDMNRIVLNHAVDLLDEAASAEGWVADAMKDEKVAPEAVAQAIKARFGDKVVSYDPSDTEAVKIAQSQGYTVLSSGMLPKEAWKVVRAEGIVKPAGQVTPSPKPYLPGQGTDRKEEPREKWTEAMLTHAAFVRLLGWKLLGSPVDVAFVNDAGCMNFDATYGRMPGARHGGAVAGKFEFNLRTLGRKWFERSPLDVTPLALTLHEFGHHFSSDHLSHEYLDALTELGAAAAGLALDEPDWVRWAAEVADYDVAVPAGEAESTAVAG